MPAEEHPLSGAAASARTVSSLYRQSQARLASRARLTGAGEPRRRHLRGASRRLISGDAGESSHPLRARGAVFALPAFTVAEPDSFRKETLMRAIVIPAAVAVAAMLTAGPMAGSAQARGCLKGAAVGGVAGHLLGHHALLGAGAGCLIGHHEASKRARERAVQQRERARYRPEYEGR